MTTVHTYLAEAGRWTSSGTTTGRDRRVYPAVGETVIIHEADDWIVDGILHIASDPPAEQRSIQHLAPFDFAIGIAEWRAEHAEFGPLIGRLLVIDDVIHSQFRTPDGRFSGVERLHLQKDGTYRATGSLFEGGTRIAAWTMTLTSGSCLSSPH